jgi:trans-aconitate methyltransferase
MRFEEAVEMIRADNILKKRIQRWADLGCGSGTFTSALASLLIPKSKIYAVDKSKSSLEKISGYKNIIIEKLHADFIEDKLPLDLDGILMANSLHYVNNKNALIKKLEQNFKSDIAFLIVEYDSDISNHWVPFPISFSSLKHFFEVLGYDSIQKMNEHPSIYGRAPMYSALIRKHNI